MVFYQDTFSFLEQRKQNPLQSNIFTVFLRTWEMKVLLLHKC